jgi:hypothetical protein
MLYASQFAVGSLNDTSFGPLVDEVRRQFGYTPPSKEDSIEYPFKADRFALVFWGRFYFPAGEYVFAVGADDGVRVFLDGRLVFDAWRDGSFRLAQTPPQQISAGAHDIGIEYYENAWLAELYVNWHQVR